LLALLERADALISGDSGPVHLAVAVECPVVAIHGPTDPGESGPFRAARAAVVRHVLPCSPCYTLDAVADCPLGHTLCQRLVSPDEVHRALAGVLAAPAVPLAPVAPAVADSAVPAG
jgi:ADP-heptose:LPS heptosyltransferase